MPLVVSVQLIGGVVSVIFTGYKIGDSATTIYGFLFLLRYLVYKLGLRQREMLNIHMTA